MARVLLTLLILLALGAGACSQGRVIRMWVGPDLVDCVGVGPQKCMLVKESEGTDWEFFYDGIEGFDHVEGVSYVLEVEITEVKDPPADASSLHYRLLRNSRIDAGQRLICRLNHFG